MAGGAPIGNQNNAKNKPWEKALQRAVIQDPNRLAKLAEKVLQMAEEGDMQAIKELGDRLDGKPKQTQEISGEITVNDDAQYVRRKLATQIEAVTANDGDEQSDGPGTIDTPL